LFVSGGNSSEAGEKKKKSLYEVEWTDEARQTTGRLRGKVDISGEKKTAVDINKIKEKEGVKHSLGLENGQPPTSTIETDERR